ncbi:hypothetical protein GCM10009069_14520 [Algimonas arctica]|uniref:Phospholipase C/D domain-containing protein n=1 Tax=Algimonas arctica TaxID=1479486 RepID=A0A8J3G298_9PROT|nr:cobalamin biosynthesis protein CobQ [Algimonas arctica]GHA92596.1 hypothetical protein GCM10009069_14520 [Algimonas arctica]
MNTPTHALVALAAFSQHGDRPRNLWVLAGALIPDLIVFLWAPWQRWGLRKDWDSIWTQHYFEEPMQTLIAMFNSVPIYAALLAFAWWQRSTKWGLWLMVFSLAALLHIGLDAPVHGHDAYRHFWPFSDWRFYSPVSYWEADLHARWVSLIEAVLVLISATMLWRRFPNRWVKITLFILLAFTLLGAGAQQLAAINIPS